MKRALLLVTILVIGAAGSMVAQAPSEEDYMKGMKEIGSAMGAIRKSMEGDPGMAAKSAMMLEAPLTTALAFWQAEGTEDAIRDTQMALQYSAELSKALMSNDSDGAAGALKMLGGTCGSCHKAHREQLPDKTYRIVR